MKPRSAAKRPSNAVRTAPSSPIQRQNNVIRLNQQQISELPSQGSGVVPHQIDLMTVPPQMQSGGVPNRPAPRLPNRNPYSNQTQGVVNPYTRPNDSRNQNNFQQNMNLPVDKAVTEDQRFKEIVDQYMKRKRGL